ncbi:unnamed protein product, partial [Pleuronectes platessa]
DERARSVPLTRYLSRGMMSPVHNRVLLQAIRTLTNVVFLHNVRVETQCFVRGSFYQRDGPLDLFTETAILFLNNFLDNILEYLWHASVHSVLAVVALRRVHTGHGSDAKAPSLWLPSTPMLNLCAGHTGR